MPFRPPFEAFVAPARRRPALWRLLLGLPTILIVYLAWLVAMGGILWLASGTVGLRDWSGRIVRAEDPGAALLLFATFGGMALGAVVAARVLHGRSAGTLFGRAPVVLADFIRAALVTLLVYAVVLLPLTHGSELVPNLPAGRWLMLLPLALAGVALQTLAEEMVFRGYLMQQIAARFRSLWPAVVIPSLLFGALHWDSKGNGGNAWALVGAVSLFAVVAADLTRRTGSLGAAWGLHFANNCLALLVISTGGQLPGLALWTTPYAGSDPQMMYALAGDIGAILIVWLILTRVLRR